jgi:transcriptional regulator with XRE-family HTH domain
MVLPVKPPVPSGALQQPTDSSADDSMQAKARTQDCAARIRAIREALGQAEGRNRPISQEEFAARVGVHPSAVKKWEGSEGGRIPSTANLMAINKVAPPELRFSLDEGCEPLPQPTETIERESLAGALDSALRSFLRGPDGRPLTAEEWAKLVDIIRAILKP